MSKNHASLLRHCYSDIAVGTNDVLFEGPLDEKFLLKGQEIPTYPKKINRKAESLAEQKG
jgi:hypothetical protein